MTTTNENLASSNGVPQESTAGQWVADPSDLPELDERITTGELEAIVNGPAESSKATVETTADAPIITATSRIGRILQRFSDRIENGANHADNLANTSLEYKEKAKKSLRSIGRSALSGYKKTKQAATATLEFGIGATLAAGDVMGDSMMAAGRSIENGMDKAAAAVQSKIDTAKENYQTRRFMKELAKDERAAEKSDAKEMKAFDKAAEKEARIQEKQDKKASKDAAREDKRFERSMRKKAAQERREARRMVWANRIESVKAYAGAKKDAFVDTSTEAKERAKAKARIYRSAGRMALETYRTSVDAHKDS